MSVASILLAAAAPIWVVMDPVANLHSSPARDADVVSQAIFGTNVEATETHEDWVRVRTPDSYLGWTTTTSLYWRESGRYATSGRVARVESLFANLYREPDVTRHQPLLTLPYEARLEVIEEPEAEDSRWIRIRLPDSREAWVQRGDVSFDHEPLTIDQSIELARRFNGLPYLWGGISTFGIDCSGFTQLLCRRRGIAIPRDSGPQARWNGAASVSPNELQPGDLLFFGKSAERITHTGMYIGNGEFIHATAYLRPRVQVNRIDDPHWLDLLVACRRPR